MKSTKFSSVIVLAAALAAFTSGAFAAESSPLQSVNANTEWQDMTGFKSTKTRAEVRAELKQAYSQGAVAQQEYVDFSKAPASTVTTRANVNSELNKSSANTILQPGDVYYGG